MKYLFLYLLVLTFGVYYVLSNNPLIAQRLRQVVQPPCSQPLSYKIGTIDPKFETSQGKLIKDLEQAESIWEKIEGRNLFAYNNEADLTINLVYDERQSLQSKINDIEKQLKNQKAEIEPTEEEYNSQVADFKKKLSELNSQIEYWNERGGAPEEEYKKLIEKQEQLKTQAAEINEMAKKLNKSAQDYNQGVDQLRETAGNLDEVTQNKPEEGVYDPNLNKIDIYLIVDQQELVHTLAHELGHALGLDHISNPKSIMYPYTTRIIVPSLEDQELLKTLCRRAS